jgi:hypothetical protein
MSILSDSILLESLEDMDVADMADETIGDYFDSSDGYSDLDLTDDDSDYFGDDDEVEDNMYYEDDDDPSSEDNMNDDDLIDSVMGGEY